MKIYIGVDHVSYMKAVPKYCWSYYELQNRRKPLPKLGSFLLDSGGFQFIKNHSKYTKTIEEYLEKVLFLQPDIFVSRDWMCEPSQLKITRLSVQQHMNRTVYEQYNIMRLVEHHSFLDYDEFPKFMGVIQGWKLNDYLHCIDQLKEHGLILDYMGIGTLCRRNKVNEIIEIGKAIKKELPNTKLHGFGVKKQVLKHPEAKNIFYSIDTAAAQFMKKRNGKWVTTANGMNECLKTYYDDLKKLSEFGGKK